MDKTLEVPLNFNSKEKPQTKLDGMVANLSWSHAEAAKLSDALKLRYQSKKTKEIDSVEIWMLKMLHCIEINHITPSWKFGKTLVELIQDATITDDQLKQTLGADKEKTLNEILGEIEKEKLVAKNVLNNAKEIVSMSQFNQGSSDNPQNSELKNVLQSLVAAVKKTQKISPRLTQMVSWSLMALSAKGRLIQVSTGEGKTCIVAMFAAFRALQGHKVDIMSSSPVLAERDFKEWQSFYKELKITVSCNINKSNTDLKKCYKCQVVYGTAHEFAGDWLKHYYGREDIRGDRPFQCAIVDEVDSLMLDKGNHTVYMSSDMPALIHLNSLIALIWDTVNQCTTEGPFILGPKTQFHEATLESISPGADENACSILQLAEEYGTINKGSVRNFRQNSSVLPKILANVTEHKLEAFYKNVENKYKVQFVLYSHTNGSIKEIYRGPDMNNTSSTVSLLILNGGVCQHIYPDKASVRRALKNKLVSALHFTPCDVRPQQTCCYVPGFFKDLIDSKLDAWIQKAFCALTMTEDHQYVIESHGVVPVDYSSTGVLQNFMQWTDGLHQFLQIKHQQKLSPMSAVTNFMSNMGLLHMYKDQIYGVTGTLGQKVETETLQNIYNGISACSIPTFKRRKLFEVEGVIVKNEDEWLQRICQIIRAQISRTAYRSERAVLVICETISRANAINKALGPSVQNKALYISNNVDNRAITDREIKGGQVIIATNLAGRGTDLRVSGPVNSAGGLFVLQTFLPSNARVEAQAFGRTGRQGSPGSAQLVICSDHLPDHIQLPVLSNELMSQLKHLICSVFDVQRTSDTQIMFAKKVRDKSVANELKNYLENVIPKMKMEQELFSQYLDCINDFYQDNNNQPAKSDVSALHEFWGVWLLININGKDPSDTLKTKLATDLERAKMSLRHGQSPLSNLHHYIQFGNELLKKGNLEDSIRMFTKAIEEDRCWAAIAFYKRAFVRLIQQDNSQDPGCIEQALKDLHQSLKSLELYCHQDDIVCRYSKAHTESDLRRSRFDKHQEVRQRLFLYFKANIEGAIKKLTEAQKMGGHVKVEEQIVEVLAISTDSLFLPIHILRGLWARDQLSAHQHVYNLDIINELQGLKSLGLSKVYVLDARWSVAGFISKTARTLRTMCPRLRNIFGGKKNLIRT